MLKNVKEKTWRKKRGERIEEGRTRNELTKGRESMNMSASTKKKKKGEVQDREGGNQKKQRGKMEARGGNKKSTHRRNRGGKRKIDKVGNESKEKKRK